MNRFILKSKRFLDKKLMMAILLIMSSSGGQLVSAAGVNSDGVTDVIEVIDPLRVVFNPATNTGYIEYAFCEKCKPVKLIITSKTEAFANGKKVPLVKVKARLGRYAGVEYEVSTKNVISVEW